MLQVADGMLLEAEGTVVVNVVHVNTQPVPACQDSQSGMFVSNALIAGLKDIGTYGSADQVDRAAIVQELHAERDRAQATTGSMRARALDSLVDHAKRGNILLGTTSYDLACSLMTSWEMPMRRDLAASDSHLHLALLAYDPDSASLMYHVGGAAGKGALYAAKELTRTGDLQVSLSSRDV